MTSFRILTSAALLALSLGLPALASEDGASVDPALQQKLTEQLVAQGYEVRKIQMEDGKIEVYAVKDGQTFELYFDSALKPLNGGEGGQEG
ncbi:MAG: PepSY domain-containing protein [Rhodobacteraceae bacterium]|nr:PepSY domain-containing protein [Paracoccaceae bacterium]